MRRMTVSEFTTSYWQAVATFLDIHNIDGYLESVSPVTIIPDKDEPAVKTESDPPPYSPGTVRSILDDLLARVKRLETGKEGHT